MKITLEMYKMRYTVEADHDEWSGDELIEHFSRLLVQAGFTPDVIKFADGGRFDCKYVEE